MGSIRAAGEISKVGVLGAGRMGLPIAVNLAAAGYTVAAFDSDPARNRELDTGGITRASSREELCDTVDLLVTVLPGPVELRVAMAPPAGDSFVGGLPAAVPLGVQGVRSGGALSQLRRGASWLDLTSSDPRVSVELAQRATGAGVHYVEAPMGGGVAAAAAAALSFYVSGADSAVQKVLPVLDVLSANSAAGEPASIHRLGEKPGAGHTAKLLANLLWFGQSIAVTEALLLGQALGLDLAILRDALAVSAGGSRFIDQHLDFLLTGDYLEDFGIDRCVEELETVAALASENDTPFGLSRHVLQLHRDALSRFGAVGGELLAAKLLEERAGTTLRATAAGRASR